MTTADQALPSLIRRPLSRFRATEGTPPGGESLACHQYSVVFSCPENEEPDETCLGALGSLCASRLLWLLVLSDAQGMPWNHMGRNGFFWHQVVHERSDQHP